LSIDNLIPAGDTGVFGLCPGRFMTGVTGLLPPDPVSAYEFGVLGLDDPSLEVGREKLPTPGGGKGGLGMPY